jgi:FlaA1/EpsC-like NDP-sugar epimerase
LIKNRNLWIMLAVDVLLVCGSYYLAFVLRFDGQIPGDQLQIFRQNVVWILPLKLALFVFFDLYRGMWRYFSVSDLINVLKACAAASVAMVLVVLVFYRFEKFSRAVFFLDFILCLMTVGGFRLMIRVGHSQLTVENLLKRKKNAGVERVLIIGAGNAGEQLLREINNNPAMAYDVVGFVDDDPRKYRLTLRGVPVLGDLARLGPIVRSYGVAKIVIAIPSARPSKIRAIVEACKATGVPYQTLPGLGDLIDGRATVSSLREVRYEDLLGRPPVALECDVIGNCLTGRSVLVTGGAGSIGSELCRQIARFGPARLIIVERNESGMYDFNLQLKADFPGLETVTVLAPVQDRGRMNAVFSRYRPRVVFHAAAYKHVPMLEENPCEAVYNNILGSKVILEMCRDHHLERCVIVSTDKAVRPTNVMGASKRVSELLARCFAAENVVKYMSVRFGNVVGSAGSVVPLFRRQIERGGPVTVTHPEATRYFMTIPEAVSLILQAGAIGQGGELFVLKMGTPVKIADMARDLISLSGFQPDVDIEIKYVGLRPGEKLYEELITKGEGIQPTRHRDIMVLRADHCVSLQRLEAQIESLVRLAQDQDETGIKLKLAEIVPEYKPQLDNPAVGEKTPRAPAEAVRDEKELSN